MRGSTVLSLLAFAFTTTALPAAARDDALVAALERRSFFTDMFVCAAHWNNPRSQCAADNIEMPADPGSDKQLPTPTGTLVHVLLGRGVQNYTCDPSAPSSTPVAVGAVASLYDATCLASAGDWCTKALTMVALEHKLDQSNAPNRFLRLPLMGHHYFTDSKSPVFNLDTANGNNGYVAVSKNASIDAPADAMKGINGQGNGAVTWLYLNRNTKIVNVPNQKTYSGVYRLNTAGGNAPATCAGQDKQISVEYAAEYWFYE